MADAPPRPQVFRRRIIKAGAFQFLPIDLFFLSEKFERAQPILSYAYKAITVLSNNL